MTPVLLLALAIGWGAQERPQSAAENFATAKALYASGAYEEALVRLGGGAPDDIAPEVDQYRALCLLALGRSDEAQQTLEQLVARRPLFTMSEAEVSPRLVTLFRAVRRQKLPDAVKALYAGARGHVDGKRWAQAQAALKDLQVLLSDEDLGEAARGLADLKVLADGFLRLADMELAEAARKEAAAREAEAARAAAPPPAPPPPVLPRYYSVEDAGVTPPVDVRRPLPPWTPPAASAARVWEFRGVLRVTIDEQGRVESASLVRPVAPGYDPLLLSATKQWEFKPAVKDGAPVKFVLLIPIVLQSR
jgi:TonB family protein